MARHKVVGKCVVLKAGGTFREFYEGALLPDDVELEARFESCLRKGLIAEVEEEAGLEPPVDEAPAKSANKPEWVAFAVSKGASEEEAEGLTKDELIELYGEK